MHRPRIGIPLGLDDRGRWRPGRSYLYIDRSYADAIQRAGGVPIHLPIQPEPESLIAGLDGLLLPGGDDLPPNSTMGEAPAPGLDPHLALHLDLVPDEQLAFDSALLAAALEAGRPVLGICYGMQLLARYGGAKLDVHLPSQRPEVPNHKLPSDADRHSIAIDAQSRLAKVLGSSKCSVNSLHHQAVSAVGSRHRVVARSPDGIIEAIEAKNEPASSDTFEIGVQWHPEKMEAAHSDLLFHDFVLACRKRAQTDQDR